MNLFDQMCLLPTPSSVNYVAVAPLSMFPVTSLGQICRTGTLLGRPFQSSRCNSGKVLPGSKGSKNVSLTALPLTYFTLLNSVHFNALFSYFWTKWGTVNDGLTTSGCVPGCAWHLRAILHTQPHSSKALEFLGVILFPSKRPTTQNGDISSGVSVTTSHPAPWRLLSK